MLIHLAIIAAVGIGVYFIARRGYKQESDRSLNYSAAIARFVAIFLDVVKS